VRSDFFLLKVRMMLKKKMSVKGALPNQTFVLTIGSNHAMLTSTKKNPANFPAGL